MGGYQPVRTTAVCLFLSTCLIAQAQPPQDPRGSLLGQRSRPDAELMATGMGPSSADAPAVTTYAVQLPFEEQRSPGEPPPAFLTKWGSTGSGDGQFDATRGVAIDLAGNIYVADRNNNRIQKFDSSGTFLAEWGAACDTIVSGANGCDGQFLTPSAVAVDFLGNVYVTETGNDRIQKFDSTGTFLSKWGSYCSTIASGVDGCDGKFDEPQGVAVDGLGNVYVVETGNDRVQRFGNNGTFFIKWGTSGSTAGQFNDPAGVATDSAGVVYIGDTGNDRIQIFSNMGNFVAQWGTTGGGDGQLDQPMGLAIDVADDVYVADFGNHRMQKFGKNGQYYAQWGQLGTGDGEFDGPAFVGVDRSGNVLVTEANVDRVQKFGPAPETLVSLMKWGTNGSGPGQFARPLDVAIDAAGDIYVVEDGNDRIQKFDSNGAFIAEWGGYCSVSASGIDGCDGQFSGPHSVEIDAAGQVYVADSYNHRVQKFDSNGTFLAKWGSHCEVSSSGVDGCDGQFDNPSGIAFDTSGFVYVVDYGNDRVQKFNSSGTLINKWGTDGSGDGQFDRPYGVAVDAAGNVYVGEYGGDRIQKFDSTGTFLAKWGALCDVGTSGVDGCDGQFYDPAIVTLDASGYLYVAGYRNHRIQKFDRDGTYLTRWGIHCDVGVSGVDGCDGGFLNVSGMDIDANGSVYVADRSNNRIQKFGSCRLTTVPSVGSSGFSGGSDTFQVEANHAECGWEIASTPSWVQITSGATGKGNGTVTFSADSNPTAIARGGLVTIEDQTTHGPRTTMAVIQDPAPCTYGLNPTGASFGGTTGSDFVDVSSLLGCAWTAVSNDAWISVDAGTAGNGDGIVLYSVTANTDSMARSGTLTIGGLSFTVNQDPQVPGAPGNFAAAAINSTKVRLSWDDGSGNEAELRVERKLGSAGTFARVLTLPPDTTGVVDSPVEKSTTYVYRVMACNSAGCSVPSAEVSVNTPAMSVFVGEVR